MTEQEKIQIVETVRLDIDQYKIYPLMVGRVLKPRNDWTGKYRWPDFTAPEWQEKIRDKVRKLWCTMGNQQWIRCEVFPDRILLFLLRRLLIHPNDAIKPINTVVLFDKSTEAEAWIAALLYLAGEKK